YSNVAPGLSSVFLGSASIAAAPILRCTRERLWSNVSCPRGYGCPTTGGLNGPSGRSSVTETDVVSGDEAPTSLAAPPEPRSAAGVLAASRIATPKELARSAPRPSPPPTAAVEPEASARIGTLVAIAVAATVSDPSSSLPETTRAYSPWVGCGVNGDGATRIVYRPWPFVGTWKWMVTVRSLLFLASE